MGLGAGDPVPRSVQICIAWRNHEGACRLSAEARRVETGREEAAEQWRLARDCASKCQRWTRRLLWSAHILPCRRCISLWRTIALVAHASCVSRWSCCMHLFTWPVLCLRCLLALCVPQRVHL